MNVSYAATELITGVFQVQESRSFSLENPNLPLNSPEIWEEIFGDYYESYTGESITATSALTCAAVYQAVSILAHDIGCMPLMLCQEVNNARKFLPDDDLTELVHGGVNESEHGIRFWTRFAAEAILFGNGYANIDRDGLAFNPSAMRHLNPNECELREFEDRVYLIRSGVTQKIYEYADIIHVEGLAYNSIQGINTIQTARQVVGLALANNKFSSKFFKNGGRIGGILELPVGMTKVSKDTVEEGFRRTYEGGDKAFQTVVLRDGAKFHQSQQSPQESQLVESREQIVREVARFFNLPPSKLGLSDSVSYNSKSEDNQAYYSNSLKYWLKAIAAECTFKLLSKRDRKRYWFEHDTSELLKMNPLQQAEYYNKMISSLVLSPNEARRMENLPPYEGGDSFQNPSTNSQSQDKTPEKQPEKAPNPTQTQPNLREIQQKHMERRIAFNIGNQARYHARNAKKFLAWIDGNLPSHREECRSLTSGESIVDYAVSELKEIANTTSEELLEPCVKEWSFLFEGKY